MASSDKWDARVSSPVTRVPHPHIHDTTYYLKCMLGGVLSCGLTHTAVVPLDVVKCKMQVFPEKYKGLLPGIKTVLAEEGSAGLRLGWAPTAIGYSMQVCVLTSSLDALFCSFLRFSLNLSRSVSDSSATASLNLFTDRFVGFVQVRLLRVF